MGLIRAWKNVRTLKRLLTEAERLARESGDDFPGPEHLVLSALELPDCTALPAFAGLLARPAQLAEAITAVHQEALGVTVEDVPPAPAPRGVYKLTPPGQQVFRDAVRLSKKDETKTLLGRHVVIAACRLEHGTFPLALKQLGIDRLALTADHLR